MKKVLIISYFFPPRPGIGSQRPYRLAKYFLQYGWEPIILTAKLPGKPPAGIRIIETNYHDILANFKSKLGLSPEKGLHEQLNISVTKNFDYPTWRSKIIKFLKEAIAFPDTNKGWFTFAINAACDLLDNEHVDAIISTSSPVTSHLIARKLEQKYKILWVADLRDLWTQNHFYNKFDLIKYFERRLELKTLADADALVTVTNRFADELKTLHKNKKIVCITNGYDPEDFLDKQSKLTSKFTITYTGGLYNGIMDPSLLFEVISKLIDENRINKDLIEIRFYGPAENWLIDDIKKYNLEGVVNYHGFLHRKVALEKQRESHLLLLLLDNNNKEISYCPAKIYEYLGARRPIIAIGGSGGVIQCLLEETNAGKFAGDADNLRNILLEYYQEFIESGTIKCDSNSNIEEYTYKKIAKRYSEILNEMVLK